MTCNRVWAWNEPCGSWARFPNTRRRIRPRHTLSNGQPSGSRSVIARWIRNFELVRLPSLIQTARYCASGKAQQSRSVWAARFHVKTEEEKYEEFVITAWLSSKELLWIWTQSTHVFASSLSIGNNQASSWRDWCCWHLINNQMTARALIASWQTACVTDTKETSLTLRLSSQFVDGPATGLL